MEERARTIPHLVLDHAFDADLVREAARQWPDVDNDCWFRYDTPIERKLTCHLWGQIPEPCRVLLGQLARLPVHDLLGVDAVPDLSLYGAGLHSMGRGDRLGIHLDADRHRWTMLTRAVNAILFVCDWQAEWGGALELRTNDPPLSVLPAFNRLVLFATNDSSLHGVPEPLQCPESVRRNSLAIYFWGAPERDSKRPRACFFDATGREVPR